MADAPKKTAPKKAGVEVECIRKFFIEDDSEEGTKQINPGEILTIPKAMAKSFQKNGVILVNIDD